tara:strand:- start:20838 stop:22478 length:1641 start_codon:yes stop_codon:yes gene_type:complete
MESRATEIIKQGDRLFSDRQPMLTLWQEIAENFYPERADFTVSRNIGTDFAGNLTTSYPILARRELGNTFQSMLRSGDWFNVGVTRSDLVEDDVWALRWLEEATKVQRRAMSDRRSQFMRATSEGDQDYSAFGQTCISIELNQDADRLLYRCWHLRDVAWAEGLDGMVNTVHRKWKPTAVDIVARFPKTASAKLKDLSVKDPYCTIECRHAVVPSGRYEPPAGQKAWKTPFVSVYIDVTNSEILEEVGVYDTIYVIPRWQTVSGSQYAYSPSTVAALPDARLLQSMTLVLLEAGEKAVDPPMIAVQEAIRSDLGLFSGGVTWVDAEYDEKLGEVLRPISQDKSGMPLGLNMQQDVRQMISEAFFLNKLNLPQKAGMTAYEVSQHIQEFIRTVTPLFGPTVPEYNGQLCDMTFDRLMRGGAFGPSSNMPESLSGQEVQFRFESPLLEAQGQVKSQKFVELGQKLQGAMQFDPNAILNVDIHAAFRDVLQGDTPADWIVPEEQVQQAMQQMAQAQQQQQEAQQLGEGAMGAASIAEQIGKAGQALNAA